MEHIYLWDWIRIKVRDWIILFKKNIYCFIIIKSISENLLNKYSIKKVRKEKPNNKIIFTYKTLIIQNNITQYQMKNIEKKYKQQFRYMMKISKTKLLCWKF